MSQICGGRAGVGGAISFAGQLWTLSVFHRWRITRTLIWGEAGAALGVVAGPIVGALFAQFSPEGWRDFFLLNAGLGLTTALFAWLGLRRQEPTEQGTVVQTEDRRGRRIIRVMTAWQVAVSMLIFASGLCMGLASVSIYSSIVNSSAPDQFLSRSMVYLMGMQIGNALGVQAVGLSEWWHLGVLTTAGLVAVVPLVITIAALGYVRATR